MVTSIFISEHSLRRKPSDVLNFSIFKAGNVLNLFLNTAKKVEKIDYLKHFPKKQAFTSHQCS